MKPQALWKVTVHTPPEAEDAVAELLQAQFAEPAGSYTDAETGATQVSVFLRSRAVGKVQQSNLRSAIRRLSTCGFDTAQTVISLTRIRKQDWAQSWKRHFRPLELGAALLIRPSWSRRRARKGQAVVILDPGLSFGTGQHPTTGFCLRQLVSRRDSAKQQSCLDLGTGSGILAIAAARLGYAPVLAVDFDPEALKAARANARRNRIAGDVHFRQGDVRELSRDSRRQFSVVCANLVSNLLIEQRDRILCQLAPGGVLVMAGILGTEFAGVRRAYEAAGVKLAASRAEGEWRSGAFRAPTREASGKHPTSRRSF